MKRFGLLLAAVILPSALAWAAEATAPAPSVSKVFDMQLSSVEKELVSLAEAMPADKYNFAPTNGEFKGVRTFAQQVKHVAATNYGMAATVLGDKPPAEVGKNEAGLDSIQTKDQIVQFVKDSFVYCHKAMATVTGENLTKMLPYTGTTDHPQPLGFWANLPIWHSYDHYGQMVVYARLNGVTPPASRK